MITSIKKSDEARSGIGVIMANENEKNFGYNIDLSTYKDDLESLWNSAINDIQQGDLEILHKHNKNGSISGVYDNNIASA